MASAAIHPKVVDLWLLINCLLLLPMFVGFLCLVLAYVMQYLMSFLVFQRKRAMVALLKVCSYCLVAVHESMLHASFLAVLWVGL